ncbi:hypothetical protein PVK06_042541 [Gossypium arboreum]|uniref:Uncharacterized protein n=1 Tax=Gossypium arboreum TaxID=29729 RepID=A0ABR0ML83_GOSAR|nr:hypothetical protein PVK06_042541 [Gossypium arboreum]
MEKLMSKAELCKEMSTSPTVQPSDCGNDNLGEDCPVFENLFEFCQIYTGGTIVVIDCHGWQMLQED